MKSCFYQVMSSFPWCESEQQWLLTDPRAILHLKSKHRNSLTKSAPLLSIKLPVLREVDLSREVNGMEWFYCLRNVWLWLWFTADGSNWYSETKHCTTHLFLFYFTLLYFIDMPKILVVSMRYHIFGRCGIPVYHLIQGQHLRAAFLLKKE